MLKITVVCTSNAYVYSWFSKKAVFELNNYDFSSETSTSGSIWVTCKDFIILITWYQIQFELIIQIAWIVVYSKILSRYIMEYMDSHTLQIYHI